MSQLITRSASLAVTRSMPRPLDIFAQLERVAAQLSDGPRCSGRPSTFCARADAHNQQAVPTPLTTSV
jgi:hypothetical protein